MARAESKLKVVNTRQHTVVQEDGVTWLDTKVKLLLDSTGDPKFVYMLPEYVSDGLEMNDRVTASTADAALEQWKNALKTYAEWKKTATAELVLVVKVEFRGADAEGKRFTNSETQHYGFRHGDVHSVGVGYNFAYRVNGKIFESKRVTVQGENGWPKKVEPPQWKPGERNHYPDGNILPYTPELQQQLDLIIATIDRAANALKKLTDQEDLSIALLSLGKQLLLT